jgi:ubiquitin-protein ligase
MVSQNKRREKDVMKLLVSQFEVHLPTDSNTSEFIVKFVGPVDSPYEGVSSHLRLT